MSATNPAAIRALAANIEAELRRLERLQGSILQVQTTLGAMPVLAPLLYKNLALAIATPMGWGILATTHV
jgi:hypothetical protein